MIKCASSQHRHIAVDILVACFNAASVKVEIFFKAHCRAMWQGHYRFSSLNVFVAANFSDTHASCIFQNIAEEKMGYNVLMEADVFCCQVHFITTSLYYK
jgi:hypothetical protein